MYDISKTQYIELNITLVRYKGMIYCLYCEECFLQAQPE